MNDSFCTTKTTILAFGPGEKVNLSSLRPTFTGPINGHGRLLGSALAHGDVSSLPRRPFFDATRNSYFPCDEAPDRGIAHFQKSTVSPSLYEPIYLPPPEGQLIRMPENASMA